MNKFNRWYILISVILLCSLESIALKEISFDKITVENGLSQSNVNYILQDSRGYIWIATNGGLNRFDGSEFKIFTHTESDSSSISNNIINHIYEDRQNNLWISTENGLNVYDNTYDTFIKYKSETKIPFGLNNNRITCTVEDNFGNFWIGTAGGGLNKFDPKNKRFKAFTNLNNHPESISSNFITSLCKDQNGFIWVGTADNGLNMLDPKSEIFLRYVKSNSGNTNDQINSNRINTIYEDNEGDLWIGTSKGLNLIKTQNDTRNVNQRDKILNFSHTHSGGSTVNKSNILSIYQGAPDKIWFGTNEDGLGFLNKKSDETGIYTINPNNEFSLLSNNISAVFYDKSGILWIGTNAGINLIDRQSDRFTWHKRIPGLTNTISSNNIQALYEENSGVLWMGTFDKGLIKYDPLTEIYTNFLVKDYLVEGQSIVEKNRLFKEFDLRQNATQAEKIHFLSHNRIYALHRDKSKRLWIGTGGGGLNILDIGTGAIKKFKHNPNDEQSLSSDIIRCIFEDKKGRIWIGTENAGLNLFTDGKFQRYVTDANDIFSISGNDIRAVAEDQNGILWIATFGGGLNSFDPEQNNFTRYIHKENSTNSLSGNSIYCLYMDTNSKLWIGTTDGLNMLDTEKKIFKHIGINNGLLSNSIYAILDDNKGNLWVSTNRGISRINKETFVVKNYDKEDGLQSTEFNAGSAFINGKGEMFFGGINGYCTFFPSEIKDNNYKPDIIFTDFKILNEKVEIGAPGSALQKHISETDTLHLSYKNMSISFEFVALNFTDSKKNTYAYKMEPFEESWNYVGERKYANYTSLPPGDYIFRVKAANNDGVWNEKGKSIYIIIEPPIWETWWFYTLLIVFIFISILFVIQWRTMALHKSKIVLEEQVKHRTIQIESQNRILGQANKEIIKQKNEIENQNILLTSKNIEISKARQDLKQTNQELISINSSLEEIVADRTSSLKSINVELTNANNELDLFIYRASHDLKGPIARLLGMTLLAKMDNKDASLKEYIDLIERGALDMNKTLNKLNNIHFLNRDIINREDIDFVKIISECRTNLVHYIDDADLSVRLNTEPHFSLKSDYILMKIILDNLLENAVFFKKTKKADIEINLRNSEKSIIISVSDKGLGILKEQHDKIFEMFYRGSERSKGNGLGLYLVKKAVQKLHGRIEVESQEGKYACFTIYFPKIIVPKGLESLVN